MSTTYTLINRVLDSDDYGQPTMIEERTHFDTLEEAETAQRSAEKTIWCLSTDIQITTSLGEI